MQAIACAIQLPIAEVDCNPAIDATRGNLDVQCYRLNVATILEYVQGADHGAGGPPYPPYNFEIVMHSEAATPETAEGGADLSATAAAQPKTTTASSKRKAKSPDASLSRFSSPFDMVLLKFANFFYGSAAKADQRARDLEADAAAATTEGTVSPGDSTSRTGGAGGGPGSNGPGFCNKGLETASVSWQRISYAISVALFNLVEEGLTYIMSQSASLPAETVVAAARLRSTECKHYMISCVVLKKRTEAVKQAMKVCDRLQTSHASRSPKSVYDLERACCACRTTSRRCWAQGNRRRSMRMGRC